MHPEKWLAVEKPLPVRLNVGLHDDWRRTAARHLGRVADARAARRRRRGRGRLGRGPLRALAARHVRRRRRAATATCWRCAGAGTARATRASSRPRCVSTVPPWRPAATPSRSCSRPPRRSLRRVRWLAPAELGPVRAASAAVPLMMSSRRLSTSARIFVRCVGGQLLVGDRLVELLGDRGLHRRLQAGDVLVLRLRDVGERLPALQLRAQRVLAQPEIASPRASSPNPPRCPDAGAAVTEAGRRRRAARRRPRPGPSSGSRRSRGASWPPSPCSLVSLPAATAASIRASAAPLIGRVELIARDVQPLGDIIEEGFLLGGVVGRLRRSARGQEVLPAAYAPPPPARTARPAAPTASLRFAEMDMRASQPPLRQRSVRTRLGLTPSHHGPVAQRLEQRTHNPSRGGSNPPWPIPSRDLREALIYEE